MLNKLKLINADKCKVNTVIAIDPENSDKLYTYEDIRKKFDSMHQEYVNSLISIGFNPENKDLLEVITFLANELNKTKAEFYHYKNDMETKLYELNLKVK